MREWKHPKYWFKNSFPFAFWGEAEAENPRLFLVYLLPSILVILISRQPLASKKAFLEQSFSACCTSAPKPISFPLSGFFYVSTIFSQQKASSSGTPPCASWHLTLSKIASGPLLKSASQTFLTLLLKRFYPFMEHSNLVGVYFLFIAISSSEICPSTWNFQIISHPFCKNE